MRTAIAIIDVIAGAGVIIVAVPAVVRAAIAAAVIAVVIIARARIAQRHARIAIAIFGACGSAEPERGEQPDGGNTANPHVTTLSRLATRGG
jgi:hypothetical protein